MEITLRNTKGDDRCVELKGLAEGQWFVDQAGDVGCVLKVGDKRTKIVEFSDTTNMMHYSAPSDRLVTPVGIEHIFIDYFPEEI